MLYLHKMGAKIKNDNTFVIHSRIKKNLFEIFVNSVHIYINIFTEMTLKYKKKEMLLDFK